MSTSPALPGSRAPGPPALHDAWDAAARILDELSEALLLWDGDGGLIYANAAGHRLLRVEGEPLRLRAAALAGRARTGDGQGPEEETVQTMAGWFRLRASRPGAWLGGVEVTAVTMTPVAGPPMGESVRTRYGLTRREAGVAGLLALGKRNAEIAAALHITEATARTHTQHILQKLGVRSRAEVAALLGREERRG